MKIPWTNIYASRTQVCIKGLYLLAIPNQAVAYDADKERVANKEAKERQLSLIEEAKSRETASKEFGKLKVLTRKLTYYSFIL